MDLTQLTDRERWQLEHGRPVPARITWALDMRGLEGPEVDEQVGTFEGNPAGDVDDWEAARATPSPEQVLALAELTRYPVGWFYKPVQPGPQTGGMRINWGGRRGCEWVPPDVVDERGVLIRDGQDPTGPAPPTQIGLFPVTDVKPGPGKAQPSRAAARRAPSPPSRARRARPEPPALLPATRMPDALREQLVSKLEAEKAARRGANHPR